MDFFYFGLFFRKSLPQLKTTLHSIGRGSVQFRGLFIHVQKCLCAKAALFVSCRSCTEQLFKESKSRSLAMSLSSSSSRVLDVGLLVTAKLS